MRFLLPLLCVFLLVAGCASKSPASPPITSAVPSVAVANPITLQGTECREVGFFVPVKASDVRDLVPAKYKITGEPGGATLLIAAATCKTYMVPGGAVGQLNISDVGIQIETVDGAPGDLTLYEPWTATDRADLAGRLEAFGMPPALSPRLAIAKTGMVKVGNPGTVKATVPWPGGAYEMSANVESASPGTAPFTLAVWWHDSDRGVLRMRHDLTPKGMNPAAGTVTTAAGTPMAKMLGGTTGAGAGVYWSFDVRSEFKLTR